MEIATRLLVYLCGPLNLDEKDFDDYHTDRRPPFGGAAAAHMAGTRRSLGAVSLIFFFRASARATCPDGEKKVESGSLPFGENPWSHNGAS